MLLNKQPSTRSLMRAHLLLLLFAILGSVQLFAGREDLKTTIILIDGEAVLVDLNLKGDILKQYIHVDDYFTSWKSHESLVKRSIERAASMRDIGHKAYDVDHHEMSTLVLDQARDHDDLQKEWCSNGPAQLIQAVAGVTTSSLSNAPPSSRVLFDWPSRQIIYREEV